MRNRAIVIVLLVAVALCVSVSLGSASTRASSPTLMSAHGAQSTGLKWGGGNAPTAPPAISISSRGFRTLIDIFNQITRPSSRRFPGQGWWGNIAIQTD